MHPAEEIFCEKSNKLRGKTVVIGITGSIAATECFSTIRELIRHGAKVIPVMTPEAQKVVTPLSIEFASGQKPITELTGQTEHVQLFEGGVADALLIYPATANTISKIAYGIDDTAVTSMATVALGAGIPVAIAPAMHNSMMENPAVKANIERLKSWGVSFIGPHVKDNRAKVASKDEIVAWVFRLTSKDDLSSKKILVIGGRSEEPIDSMRIITNRSTGLMALRLAERAFSRGSDVELWMGGASVIFPEYLKTKRFETVDDLVKMVDKIDHDIVIVPAALADFTPEHVADGKIPSDIQFDVSLKPVQKVLPLIRKKCKTVIGFKAESGLSRADLIAKARSRLEAYDLAAVVANDVDAAGKSSTTAILVTKDRETDITGKKTKISDAILDYCVGLQ
ncbi:MAG: bifunctional phosphopantothenoylcysteine decarboxylase/phosphopantothenate--cysteine ligase CoaBC [Candidatus Methanomethylophilaceae archaeon]|nr:bifunctional phosphopantothenoylcysteine decarboxylase/phosphopantothenate--cysteine ligase CoaBC [Candidatus Methanomethylophilaceae archaeon]